MSPSQLPPANQQSAQCEAISADNVPKSQLGECLVTFVTSAPIGQQSSMEGGQCALQPAWNPPGLSSASFATRQFSPGVWILMPKEGGTSCNGGRQLFFFCVSITIEDSFREIRVVRARHGGTPKWRHLVGRKLQCLTGKRFFGSSPDGAWKFCGQWSKLEKPCQSVEALWPVAGIKKALFGGVEKQASERPWFQASCLACC